MGEVANKKILVRITAISLDVANRPRYIERPKRLTLGRVREQVTTAQKTFRELFDYLSKEFEMYKDWPVNGEHTALSQFFMMVPSGNDYPEETFRKVLDEFFSIETAGVIAIEILPGRVAVNVD